MQIERWYPSDFLSTRDMVSSNRRLPQVHSPLPAREKISEIQPMVINKEIIERFSEWYLRMGKAYESTKSYRQAISAYEKSYAVSPAFSKALSIENIRGKIFER